MFNWICGHFPKEVQLPLGILTRQMRRDAALPMPPEAVRAKSAIQKPACQAARSVVIDMAGARSRER
eukprot:2991040-Lingulodinium_polyedra.AAC.1